MHRRVQHGDPVLAKGQPADKRERQRVEREQAWANFKQSWSQHPFLRALYAFVGWLDKRLAR